MSLCYGRAGWEGVSVISRYLVSRREASSVVRVWTHSEFGPTFSREGTESDPGRSCTWHTRARERWWSLPMARRYFIISFEARAYTRACKRGALAPVTARHDVVPTHPRLNAVLTPRLVVFQAPRETRASGREGRWDGFCVWPSLERGLRCAPNKTKRTRKMRGGDYLRGQECFCTFEGTPRDKIGPMYTWKCALMR